MRFIKKVKNYLFPSEPFCRFDNNMRKYLFWFLVVSSSDRLISLFFSFCMQLSSNYQKNGNYVIALVFLCLYFLRDTFDGLYRFVLDNVRRLYNDSINRMSSEKVIRLLDSCRSKVYVQSDNKSGILELMDNNKLINTSKSFLGSRVDLVSSTLSNLFSVVMIILTIIGILKTTQIQGNLIPAFASILVFIVIIYSLVSVLQIRFRKENYKKIRKLRDKQDSAYNSILNNEPISEKQSKYRISTFLGIMRLLFVENRNFSNKLNVIALIRSVTRAIGCFVLISFYINSNGGINNLSATLFLQLIAFTTLFQNLVREVSFLSSDILGYVEKVAELDEYSPNFEAILEVYNENNSRFILDVERVEITKGATFTYPITSDATKPFSLSIIDTIEFSKGDIVSVFGKTGNGKTTFIKILTSRLKWTNGKAVTYYPPLNDLTMIPSSLVISRDSRLGAGNLLSEITCIDENSILSDSEKNRLIRILKGVCLYDELLEKNPNVIQQLKDSTLREYSSGQQARLVVANLLYNIVDDISIIAFDEITSSLDDETTIQVMQFIIDELSKNRILIFVSHQNIIKRFANVHLDVQKGLLTKN